MSRAITTRTKRVALRVPVAMHQALTERAKWAKKPLAGIILTTLDAAGFGYYDGSKGRPLNALNVQTVRPGTEVRRAERVLRKKIYEASPIAQIPKRLAELGIKCKRPEGAPPCGKFYRGWTCCQQTMG
jgi:hypothetical protein